MSDDLTVMGIAATRRQRWGESDCSRASGGAPACGQPGCRDRPEAEPDLAVALALPGRCLQVGFDRHQQRLVRSRASVPDALPAAARRAGRRSWRRTRSGPCPRRRRPAAGRRPDPCRARWRHSSPRPPPFKGPGLRLGLQQSTMVRFRCRNMAYQVPPAMKASIARLDEWHTLARHRPSSRILRASTVRAPIPGVSWRVSPAARAGLSRVMIDDRLCPTLIKTSKKIVASMSGTSRILRASTVRAPIPGQPNTVDDDHAGYDMVSSPMVVTIGMAAFFSAWADAIFEIGMPRPRAAVT